MISGPPDDVRLGMIFEKFVPALLVRQSMAGLGMKEARGVNTKAAQLVLGEWEKYRQRVSTRMGEEREPVREISPFIPQERKPLTDDDLN